MDTSGDSDNDITWSTFQDTEIRANEEMNNLEHTIAIARTDNGEIIIAYTADYRDMGKELSPNLHHRLGWRWSIA